MLGFDVLCFALFEHYFVCFWVSCGVTRLLIEMFDKIVDMQEIDEEVGAAGEPYLNEVDDCSTIITTDIFIEKLLRKRFIETYCKRTCILFTLR